MKLYCEKCGIAFPVKEREAGTEAECPECHAKINCPDSPTAPGVVIGDFRIIRHLSKGGMGDVFLAHQISLDRPAALKVLQEKFVDDKEYVDSLIREARSAAKLNHPNIVQAYAVGREDGVFYFAMEFVQGQTFKTILQKEKVLDFEQAAKVIRQVADALDFAWKEQKLVHQDIKPDNIMLDSHGRAKLADLGLARSANAEFDSDSEEVLGTPQYISPEQLTGVPTDVRSDIYSLGATFYQFVTGRFPYVADSVEELAKMHVAGNLEPPKHVNPELPDELNTIIMKMMARKLDERYQSPKILIQALDLYLNQGQKKNVVPALKLNHPKRTGPVPPASAAAAPAKEPELPKPSEPKVALPPKAAVALKVPVPPKAVVAPKVPVPPKAVVAPKIPVPPVVPPPAAAPEEEKNEKPAEKPKTKRRLLVVLLSLGVLLVLAAAGAGGIFFLYRIGKLPGFLKISIGKIGFPVPGGASGNAVPAASGKSAAGQTQEAAPAAKPEPPPPVKPAPAMPPPPQTRPEYLAQVQELLNWNRTHPGEGRAFMELISEQWPMLSQPRTREEEAAFALLGGICGAVDENVFMAPERTRRREAHQAAVRRRREEAEKIRKERSVAEKARKEQAAELARKNAEIQARGQEVRESEKVRIAEMERKAAAQKNALVAGFFAWGFRGDPEPYRTAKRGLDEWQLTLANATATGKTLETKLRRLAQEIPQEVKRLEQFRESLKKYSFPNSGFGLPRKKGTYAIIAVAPDKVTIRNQRTGQMEAWDLDLPRMRPIFFQIMIKKTGDPHFGFYYDVLSLRWSEDRYHTVPKGFWKNYWNVLKPHLNGGR